MSNHTCIIDIWPEHQPSVFEKLARAAGLTGKSVYFYPIGFVAA